MDRFKELNRLAIEYKESKTDKERIKLQNAIYELTCPYLNKYFISQLFSTQEAIDYKDLSSIAMSKIFENFQEYDSKYSFSTWVATIAKHVFIDELRTKSNKKQRLTTQFSKFSFYDGESRDAVEYIDFKSLVKNDGSEDRDETSYIIASKILDKIKNVQQKEALRLYSLGYKYKEIAEMMGKNMSCVQQYIFMARKHFFKLCKGTELEHRMNTFTKKYENA